MGTTADKLNKVEQTKAELKAAINNTGCPVIADSDTFASYSDKISTYLVYLQKAHVVGSAAGRSATTYTITSADLVREPDEFILAIESDRVTGQGKQTEIVSVVYDGTHTDVISAAVSGNTTTYTKYTYAAGASGSFNWTYNEANHSLTFTSSDTRNVGYFVSGALYGVTALMY